MNFKALAAEFIGTFALIFVGGGLDNLWIYWVGPVLGGVVAGLVYHNIIEQK